MKGSKKINIKHEFLPPVVRHEIAKKRKRQTLIIMKVKHN